MIIIAEDGLFRRIWDHAAVALILVGCAVIPYQLVFERRVTLAGILVVAAIDLFFLIDIRLNFLTSYRRHGVEVRDPKALARRYTRTLLPLDIAAVTPLDLVLLGFGAGDFHGLPLVLLLRMNRLLRVARLAAIFRRWESHVWSRSGSIRIAKFLVTILLVIHWTSCAWFLVPYLEGFPDDSWVTAAGIGQAPEQAQYVRSLYWAVVTMTTVGYGDITPNRTVEYVFTILVMMIGASMYAFIIGNIASLFSGLDAARARYFNQVEATDEYLRARGVSAGLHERIRRYYDYLWERHRGMRDERLFVDLPSPVKLDVLLELTSGLRERMPLFRHCSETLRNVLVLALKPQVIGPGVFVVRDGDVPHEVYLLSRGRAEILTAGRAEPRSELSSGDQFGLLSLLLGERRTASVRTLTYCDIFVLLEEDFERIKGEYPEFRDVLRKVSAEKSEKMSSLLMDGVIL